MLAVLAPKALCHPLQPAQLSWLSSLMLADASCMTHMLSAF